MQDKAARPGLSVPPRRASPAGAPAPGAAGGFVEMEMVAMGRIVIGGEDGREQAAAAVAHVVQETAFGPLVVPVGGDGDPGAVLQPKAGDVDRIGPRMLAPQPVPAPVHPPAA